MAGRINHRALAAGAKVLRGGHRHVPDGWTGRPEDALWIEPTLIAPASNDSEIVQHEVFGPVLTFQTFVDEDEAIRLANSTAYGLSATLFTGSAERAERVGGALRAGTTWVNCFLVRDLTAPFGGLGISGLGREGGRDRHEAGGSTGNTEEDRGCRRTGLRGCDRYR